MATLQLWLPCFVLAHVFALFWLVKAFVKSRNQHRKAVKLVAADPRAESTEVDLEVCLPALSQDPGKALSAAVGHDSQEVKPRMQPVPSSGSLSSSWGSGGSVLHTCRAPAVPVAMTWEGLGCSYKVGGTTKVVLQDVSGQARPGQMQALMGPSGAGKSTLMDMLTLRKSVGTLTGSLLVNGRPVTRSSFIRMTAYVPQDDNFIPTMSGQETLSFHAGVLLGDGWTREARKERVSEVLSAVGLGHAADTLVGGTLPGGLHLRGLSGGERRRLSIAAGILGGPSVLFLDEPTSGLDSFAALSVMGYLQDLAAANQQTIIATIHQPRSAIWEMFHTVSLLASGRLMYHGPCAEVVPWFVSLGYSYTRGSESDWVLDLVATGFNKPNHLFGKTLRTKEDVALAADAFKAHYTKGSQATLDARSKDQDNTSDSSVAGGQAVVEKSAVSWAKAVPGRWQATLTSQTTYTTGWWRQFGCLFGREFAGMTRNPYDVTARILTSTYVALLFGLFGYNSNLSSVEGLQSLGNYIYGALLSVMLLPYISISLYTNDKKHYLADASSKLYRPSAYYVAKVAATLPFALVYMLAFSGVWYGMGGLRAGATHFFKFYVIVALFNLIACQVLHLCAVLAPNLDTTFAMAVAWTTLQHPTCSFYIRFSLVYLQGLTYLRYISANYFALEALMVNQMKGGITDCSAGMGSELVETVTTGFANASAFQKAAVNQLQDPQPGCVFHEDVLLQTMDFSRSFSASSGILLGYLGVLHVLTYLSLLLVARRERR